MCSVASFHSSKNEKKSEKKGKIRFYHTDVYIHMVNRKLHGKYVLNSGKIYLFTYSGRCIQVSHIFRSKLRSYSLRSPFPRLAPQSTLAMAKKKQEKLLNTFQWLFHIISEIVGNFCTKFMLIL